MWSVLRGSEFSNIWLTQKYFQCTLYKNLWNLGKAHDYLFAVQKPIAVTVNEWMTGYYLISNSRKSGVLFTDVWADSHGRLALVATFFTVECRILEPGEDMSPSLCVSDSFLEHLMDCTFQVCFNVLKSTCMFFWKSFFGLWSVANGA